MTNVREKEQMKKKVLVVLAIFTLSMSIVTACGSKKAHADENLMEMITEATEENGEPVVVNTEEVTETTESEIETEIIETTEEAAYTDNEMEQTKDTKSASDTGKKDTGSNSAKSGTTASGTNSNTTNNAASGQTSTDKQTSGNAQSSASASSQVNSNNTEQAQNTQTGNNGQTSSKEQTNQPADNNEQAGNSQNASSGNGQEKQPEQSNNYYETTTEATTDVITFPDGSTSTSYHPAGSPVEVSRETKYLDNGEQIIYIYYSDGSMEVIGSSYDAVDPDMVYQSQP